MFYQKSNLKKRSREMENNDADALFNTEEEQPEFGDNPSDLEGIESSSIHKTEVPSVDENKQKDKKMVINKDAKPGQIAIDINGIEDLMNAMKFSAKKLEEVNKTINFAQSTKDFERLTKEVEKTSELVKKLDIEKLNRQVQISIKQMRDTMNNNLFEIEKFDAFKSYMKNFKLKYFILVPTLSVFVTGTLLISTGVVEFSVKNFNKIIQSKTHYVIPKAKWRVEKNKIGPNYKLIKKGN